MSGANPLPLHNSFGLQKLAQVLSSESFEDGFRTLSMAQEHLNRSAKIKAFNKSGKLLNAELHQINSEVPEGDSWTTHSATFAISQLRIAAKCFETSEMMGDVYDMQSMVKNWESAQSCLSIYRWYLEVGPNLADHLFKMGTEELTKMHPDFHLLIERIYDYLKTAHKLKQKKTGNNQSPTDNLESLRKIDASIFAPLSMTAKKIVTLMSPPQRISPVLDQQAKKVFLQFISDAFIMDHIKSIDKAFVEVTYCNQGSSVTRKRLDSKPAAIRARLIARGGIHWCFWKVFGGDSDAWAMLPGASDLLLLPRKIFNCRIDTDEVLGNKIEANPEVTLSHLIKTLQQYADNKLNIAGEFDKLAGQAFGIARQFEGGPSARPIKKTEAQARRGRLTSRLMALDATITNPTVTLPMVCSNKALPSFALPALLVREALNKERYPTSSPVGDIHIERLYNALHPINGKVIAKHHGNVDHFNPVRSKLKTTDIIRDLFVTNAPCADFITTGLGLANAATFLSTGQGDPTRKFLSTYYNKPFQSLEECVAQFDSAKRAQDLMNDKHQMPFFNLNVWGQPSNYFAVHPTVPGCSDKTRLTTKQKFAPFFDKSLQERWERFWKQDNKGHSRSSDPEWLELLDWIEKESLLCFGRGSLTALQFANTIIILRGMPAPPCHHIADWIADNWDKGAINGLVLMGFDRLRGGPKEHNKDKALYRRLVTFAFTFVFNFLDKHLSSEDKKLLGFDTIFVEQLLCKVSRYDGNFNDNTGKDTVTLQSLANKALLTCKAWIAGKNLKDKTGQLFPFPLSL